MKKSVIALSIAASVPMFSNSVQAQDAVKPIEKIEVTGSKIKRSDMETASPVTIIGAEDIKASGAVTVRRYISRYDGCWRSDDQPRGK